MTERSDMQAYINYKDFHHSQLAQNYCPIFYLHPDEKVKAMSLDTYFETSGLAYTGEEKPIRQQMSSDVAVSAANIQHSIRPVVLIPSKEQERPTALAILKEHSAEKVPPVYCRIHEITRKNRKMLRLSYWYFFAENPALNLCCVPPNHRSCCAGGYHKADLEHCAIYLDSNTLEPIEMYFATHGRFTGLWRDWKTLEMENNRPVVYLAVNSHASYPSEGQWWRLCCVFANDFASKSGQRWDPLESENDRKDQGRDQAPEDGYSNVVLLKEDFPYWNAYQGYLGYPDHVHVPRYHYSWTEDSEIEGTLWRRLFDCLL